jgi:hypothetical protein
MGDKHHVTEQSEYSESTAGNNLFRGEGVIKECYLGAQFCAYCKQPLNSFELINPHQHFTMNSL